MPNTTAPSVIAGQDFSHPLQSKPLGDNGRKFEQLRNHIKQEVPGDQKEHGADTERISNDWIDNIPRPAQVEQQGSGIEDISQKAIQDRCSDQTMILLES